jgi:hypothetical protein
MYAEELPALQFLPLDPFRYYDFGKRTVPVDGCVEVATAYHRAPPNCGCSTARGTRADTWVRSASDSTMPRASCLPVPSWALSRRPGGTARPLRTRPPRPPSLTLYRDLTRQQDCRDHTPLLELDRALRKLRVFGMADASRIGLARRTSRHSHPLTSCPIFVGDELGRRQERLFARRIKHAGFRAATHTL